MAVLLVLLLVLGAAGAAAPVNAGMTGPVECYALAGQDIDDHHDSVPSGPVRPEEAGPR